MPEVLSRRTHPASEREPARGGRPPIGPKVQPAIPEEWYQHMKDEAAARGVRVSVVAREVIIAGCSARYGAA